MTVDEMTGREWTCDECRKPILKSAGVLVLYNANEALGNIGGYPQKPSADLDAAFNRELIEDRREREEDTPKGFVLLEEVVPAYAAALAANPPNVGIMVCHSRCIPWPEEASGPYVVRLSQLRDGEHLADWILHFSEKNWMGKRDLLNLVRRYVGRPME